MIGFRCASSGYARVGEELLNAEQNVHAIRSACKDLTKVAKGDASGSAARILSVVLIAMHAKAL